MYLYRYLRSNETVFIIIINITSKLHNIIPSSRGIRFLFDIPGQTVMTRYYYHKIIYTVFLITLYATYIYYISYVIMHHYIV